MRQIDGAGLSFYGDHIKVIKSVNDVHGKLANRENPELKMLVIFNISYDSASEI